MTLPPIREWWPHLSTEARQSLLDGDLPHLSEEVRAEVREITGAVVGITEALSDDDVEYAAAEVESSDGE